MWFDVTFTCIVDAECHCFQDVDRFIFMCMFFYESVVIQIVRSSKSVFTRECSAVVGECPWGVGVVFNSVRSLLPVFARGANLYGQKE